MSWHFSLALEAEFLRGRSWDGEPSAQSKSILTALDDSCSDKMKGIFHRSPFGTMYAPSTVDYSVAVLTWYLVAFLAQTSAPLGKKRESMVKIAGSGWKWRESFARYDRDSHSLKTRQHSLIEGSDVFSQTWPRWGLMLDGECLDLTMWAPITEGKGAGSWPTPCHGSSHWGGTFQEVGGSKNKLRNTPIGRMYVNPDFWENLMGWPIGWTGIAPLETARILEWQLQLLDCCKRKREVNEATA